MYFHLCIYKKYTKSICMLKRTNRQMSVKSFYYIIKVLINTKVEVRILVEDLNVYIEMVEYIYCIVYLVFGMWGINVEGLSH